MSLIIGVFSRKGGVGKTTTALHIGAAFLEADKAAQVRFVDADEQQHLNSYRPFFARIKRARFEISLDDFDGTTVIDLPANFGSEKTANMVQRIDVLLIPVQAEPDAVDEAGNTLAFARRVRPDLPVKMVLTMYSGAKDVKGECPSRKAKVKAKTKWPELLCKAQVPRSANFTSAAGVRETIFKYAPDSTGAKAYRKLAEELRNS